MSRSIGENRKLLVFPLSQLPEMARGKGVRLQRYKDGGLSDARVFAIADGLTWRDSAGRTFTVAHAGTERMDRQPRRSRPAAAERVSEEQSVRGVGWRTARKSLDLFSSVSSVIRCSGAVFRDVDATREGLYRRALSVAICSVTGTPRWRCDLRSSRHREAA